MTSLRSVRIGIIGAGKMGQALIKGLLATGLSPNALRAADADAATRKAVSQRFSVQVAEDNLGLVRWTNVVIVAVKPQQCHDVIVPLASELTPQHLVISIVAGITLRWWQAKLPGVPVVRVMPNLPATVGAGFSAIAWGPKVRPRHRAMARAIVHAVGEVAELPERHFDAITAVSGSGPAYVFSLVQMWEDAARALGLPKDVASAAIAQTLSGSVALLRASGEPAGALVSQVASKGGTTEAALKVFEQRRLRLHMMEALRAAAQRSKQLSERYQI
ncbi:MAG: pyrroline-5-carboxylate reductase [Candidatus Omnitrophica bacterium]|nr:pyrroline-5-carboxylate reductase [Candidatus Omnitrophota bacterium]